MNISLVQIQFSKRRYHVVHHNSEDPGTMRIRHFNSMHEACEYAETVPLFDEVETFWATRSRAERRRFEKRMRKADRVKGVKT